MSDAIIPRQQTFWVFVLYLAFVIYGSLIPFELRPHTLDQAVQMFSNIRYLHLGVASRADWIANIVLYVPLAFLGCEWLANPRRSSAGRVFAVVLIGVFCLVTAVSVEFAQIFFAPRTVSLNDLLAETLGSIGGITIWLLWRRRLNRLMHSFRLGGHRSILAAVALYLSVYLVLALFPYDFLVSAKELSTKFASSSWGWVIAGNCGGWLRCSGRLTVETIGLMPLGVLLALAAPRRLSGRRLFVAGILLGLLIEFVQLFLASGVSQGLSMVTRGIGLVAGAFLGDLLCGAGPAVVGRILWRLALILALPYVLGIAALHGWFSRSWIPFDQALERFTSVSLIPFYYHYFTTEPNAVSSLLAQVAAYAPIGVVLWSGNFVDTTSRYGASAAFWLAASVALLIELGKLWVPPNHPDFTNLLIAGFSTVFAYAAARWVSNVLAGGASDANIEAGPMVKGSLAPPEQVYSPAIGKAAIAPRGTIQNNSVPDYLHTRPDNWTARPPARAASRIAALGLFAVAMAAALSLPAFPAWVATGLLVYTMLVLRRPVTWLLLLPPILAVTNLTPWTGRMFFDESDIFVIATLAVFLWRGPWNLKWFRRDAFHIAFILLATAYGISTLLVLLPFPSLNANAFAHYYSPFNSLRIAKSAFWALLLWPQLHATAADGEDVPRWLGFGFAFALAGVALSVLFERWVYVGVFDLVSEHRVAGTFASMHTGGAFLDGFLALTIPFVLLLSGKKKPGPLLAWILGLLALYAALVTYSRGTYVAVIVAAVVLFVSVANANAKRSQAWRLSIAATLLVTIGLVIAISTTGFMQSRWDSTVKDAKTRLQHWQNAVFWMDDGIAPALFGMGPGTFPVVYFLHNLGGQVPTYYRFEKQSGTTYLHARLGLPVYLDQRIGFDPNRTYQLALKYRTSSARASISIGLCEKSFLYSYQCNWYSPTGQPSGDWIDSDQYILPGSKGGKWHPLASRVISVMLGGKAADLDLGLISLRDDEGHEYVLNGDFRDGMDHWFPTDDNHLPWHIKNLWIGQYFDIGLFGVYAFTLFALVVVTRLVHQIRQGDRCAPVYLAALLAVGTVGVISSLFDDPRLGLLIWLFLLVVGDRARLAPRPVTAGSS